MFLSGELIGLEPPRAVVQPSPSPVSRPLSSSQTETVPVTQSFYMSHAQLVCLGNCLLLLHIPDIFPHFFKDICLLSLNSCCASSISFSSRTDVGVSYLSLGVAALLKVLLCFPGSPSCLDGRNDRGGGVGGEGGRGPRSALGLFLVSFGERMGTGVPLRVEDFGDKSLGLPPP